MLGATVVKPVSLIDWNDSFHNLGVQSMDSTHQAMVSLVNRLMLADKKLFVELFTELYLHTEDHFAAEERLMKESGFPATEEHISEHRRIMADLTYFNRRCEKGSTQLARAYICDKLPEWFALHLITMDQALAVHLQKQNT